MNKQRLVTTIIAISLLLVGCDPTTPTPSPAPQSWIDSPLPGSYSFIGLYHLVFHAASLDGVTEFEISINGNVEAVVPPQSTGPGGGGMTLFYGELTWGFGAPGTYLIQVRAKSGGGVYGPPAQVGITITEDVLEALSPTEEVTEDSPTPTNTPEPVVADGTGFDEPNFSEMEIYYRGSCGPRQLTIDIQATDPEAYSVVVFLRLADQNSSDQTEWTAMAMTPGGDGRFAITLSVEGDVPLYWSYLQSFLQLQFVATSQDGEEVGRSPVYSEITVETCGI
jgi:hypothetical protein